MLVIKDLTVRIGGKILLDHANAHVLANHRTALVGRNGAGKSTLLKVIRGELQGDTGSVECRTGIRTGFLAQETPDGPESLLDTVLAADVERSSLLTEAETATDPTRISDIHIRLSDIDAHSAPARASRILAGLGFDEEAQQQSCSDFSGGWRMRVALAAVLFAEPEFLLLDEPSNYLDLEATLWLENHLRRFPHTLMLVSHDRQLLNNVADNILHLEGQTLTRYAGNYDAFEAARYERLEQDAAARVRHETQRKHLQSFVDRFSAKATKARQAQSRVKMLEKMKPPPALVAENGITFRFPDPKQLPPPLITLDNASVGYDGKAVLNNLSLRIDMDDRIALLGSNGNGKSTFAKLLAGRLKAMSGDVRMPGKIKVGYFAQHQIDEFSPGDTAFQHMQRLMPSEGEARVRARLGQFSFTKDMSDLSVERLSGGEKARLLFALISHAAPHMLILDEPTNHLDVDSREALIQALNDYQGAVLLISHDPHLVELAADRLWLVEGGAVAAYDGDMQDYRQKVLGQKSRNQKSAKQKKAQSPAATGNKKQQRQAKAKARALAKAQTGDEAGENRGENGALPRARPKGSRTDPRKAARKAERKLEGLSAELAEIEVQLSNPALYQQESRNNLDKLTKQRAAVTESVEIAEQEWLVAQEAAE